MKKFLLILLCFALLFTVSCEQTSQSRESHGSSDNGKTEKLVPPVPADYISQDIEYSVNISDSARTVSFDATRCGGINTATLSFPEELAGMILTDDAGTLRIFPNASRDAELTVSEEAAAGLSVIFDLMERQVSAEEFTENGTFEFALNGYEVLLTLSDDGYPITATLTDGEYTRSVDLSVRPAP